MFSCFDELNYSFIEVFGLHAAAVSISLRRGLQTVSSTEFMGGIPSWFIQKSCTEIKRLKTKHFYIRRVCCLDRRHVLVAVSTVRFLLTRKLQASQVVHRVLCWWRQLRRWQPFPGNDCGRLCLQDSRKRHLPACYVARTCEWRDSTSSLGRPSERFHEKNV